VKFATALVGAGFLLIILGVAIAVGLPAWAALVIAGVAVVAAGLFAVDVDRRPPEPPAVPPR
jgi:hypothetical protein